MAAVASTRRCIARRPGSGLRAHPPPARAVGARGRNHLRLRTDGPEAALEQAKAAAREKDVLVAGGAETWAQFPNKGLLDQLEIHLAPVLLGAGIRLFDRVEAGKLALEPERVVESPAVTHARYRVTS
jgi:dihydrofolate reductase